MTSVRQEVLLTLTLQNIALSLSAHAARVASYSVFMSSGKTRVRILSVPFLKKRANEERVY